MRVSWLASGVLPFDRRLDEPRKPRGCRPNVPRAGGPLDLQFVPLIPGLLLRSRRPLSSTTAALLGLESDRKWIDMQQRALLKMAPLAAHPPLIRGARSTSRECASARK